MDYLKREITPDSLNQPGQHSQARMKAIQCPKYNLLSLEISDGKDLYRPLTLLLAVVSKYKPQGGKSEHVSLKKGKFNGLFIKNTK